VCVFRACGGVLELGVVLMHKSVSKVLTRVLQRVRVHVDGTKCVFVFLTRYTLLLPYNAYDALFSARTNSIGKCVQLQKHTDVKLRVHCAERLAVA